LLTTLHREDLNPLDKAEALLKEITEETGIAAADVPRLLSTVVRRLDYQKRMKQVSDLATCPEGEQEERLEKYAPKGGARQSQSSANKVLRGLKELSLSGIEREQLLEFCQELLSKLSEVEAALESPSRE
jgi:hypothetical protein